MADRSLITDELLAYKDKRGPARRVLVTNEVVERSLRVYGRLGTAHFEAGEVVPGFALMSLSPDGQVEELRIPEPLPQSLMISNEFSLERPLRLGEELTAQSCIADVSERLGGRFGHAIYVRTELEFREAGGAVVGRTASTLMYYRTDGSTGEEAS